MQNSDPAEPLISERAAAELLNVSYFTLVKYRSGQLPVKEKPPFYCIGDRMIRYRASELLAWAKRLAEGRHTN